MPTTTEVMDARKQLGKIFLAYPIHPKIIFESEDELIIETIYCDFSFNQLVLLMSVSECNLKFIHIQFVLDDTYSTKCRIVYKKIHSLKHHFIRRIYDDKNN